MPDVIVRRSRRVISRNLGSRSASSGTYFVTRSSTLSISPASIAIPTSVDTNDFATENDVSRLSRVAPPKYRSYTRRSSWTTTKASVSVSRRKSSSDGPRPLTTRSASDPAGRELARGPAAISRAGNRSWSPTSDPPQIIARAIVDSSVDVHAQP
jgi:hypothetical protein